MIATAARRAILRTWGNRRFAALGVNLPERMVFRDVLLSQSNPPPEITQRVCVRAAVALAFALVCRWAQFANSAGEAGGIGT